MLEAGSVQKDHSRLSLFIELSSPNWLWPVFKTLFLDIWALIRRSLIQYCTLLYNLSFQSLIANPSFPPSRHCSPPVLHVCSAVAVSPPRTHTQQQGQDSEPSFRITNKLLPANSTPVVQRDPGGSSERVSHEVLHCHVWEESRSVTHGPRSFLCCAAPSFHWHPRWGCVKAGLEAGFTHSFSHRYTLSISFLGGTGKGDLSPALCPDFGGNKCQFHTVVYEHSGDSCICAPTQAAEGPTTLQLWDTSSGWREMQSTPVGYLSHGRTGWTHPCVWIQNGQDTWNTTHLAVLRSLKYFQIRVQSYFSPVQKASLKLRSCILGTKLGWKWYPP